MHRLTSATALLRACITSGQRPTARHSCLMWGRLTEAECCVVSMECSKPARSVTRSGVSSLMQPELAYCSSSGVCQLQIQKAYVSAMGSTSEKLVLVTACRCHL